MGVSRRLFLSLGCLATLSGGCAGLPATPTNLGSTDPEVFSRTHERADGMLVSITDYVTAPRSGEPCEAIVRQTTVMAPHGQIVSRSVEWRRCGVTESRMVERFPAEGEPELQSLAVDDDHDGAFDWGWDRGGDRT